MYDIFIDESGIHRTSGHSCLALAYVMAEDVEYLAHKIIEIERKLGIAAAHWSQDRWEVRAGFLGALAPLPFTVKIAVVHNPVNVQAWFENSLTHFMVERSIGRVVIDGKKPKWEERRLRKILRDKGIAVKKLRTVRDEAEPVVRLADAIAGMTRNYFDNPAGAHAQELYRLYQNKITAQLVGGQASR